jgi:mercuric ion binding protein
MKTTILLTVLLGLFACSTTKDAASKKQTVQLMTNAECGTCKSIMEKELNYVKGISFAELDVASKVLTVKYSPDKISLDEIKVLVSQIGYNADDVKADPQAQSKLPACCQPGGMKK